MASRQLMLTQRIENNMNRVLAGGEGAAAAADRFGRDAARFGSVLEGMLKGSRHYVLIKLMMKWYVPSCVKLRCYSAL